MTLGTTEILIGIIFVLSIIYYYLTNTFNYWKEKGIPGPKPIPIFGTLKNVVLGKYPIGIYLKHVCDAYPNEPMIGIFARKKPVLILNDMDLIKSVLIKDFKYFMNRGIEMNEKHSPLSAHLFGLDAKRWRPMRMKLTPVFTSGKLKDMFYLLMNCANKLDEYLDRFDGQDVDIRDISARFTTDVIGICAFGLEANALEDENSTFRQMGKKSLQVDWKTVLRFRLSRHAPMLYDLLEKWIADHTMDDFFINLTRDTIDYRTKNNINRHDFIDLLAALRHSNNKIDDIELTDSLLAAQLFVFFLAGFETSSSVISNCLFELALNQNIQSKLREEIKVEAEKTDGKFSYESIKNMTYLEKVFCETLRKYPPLMFIMRKSMDSYTFPGTKITIPTDTPVFIPNYAIQHDPQYFPNPEIFDPERFIDEEIAKRHPMSYLPFGDGPRNCIGLRFGQMQTKVGLVKVLQNHTVHVCEKTDKDYTLNNRSFLLTPINGIVLRIRKEL